MSRKVLGHLLLLALAFLVRAELYAADVEHHASEGTHHFLTRWHDWALLGLIICAIALLVINHFRIRSQKALRESEGRFRALADRSMVGISVVQDDKYKFVNPRLAEMFGCSIDELLDKKGPIDFVHPDDRRYVGRSMRRRIAGDQEFAHYEARMVNASGEIRDVEVFGSRMIYHGRPAVVATLLDITERKRTAQELQKAHSDLHQIFHSAAPLYVISRDYTVERVNDTFCSYIGRTAEEVVGRKCYEVWPGSRCNTRNCPMDAIVGGEERLIYEREHIRADGSRVAFTATALPYRDVDGSVAGIIASFGDVTDLKDREDALRQSEERGRAQFKSIPVPTYIWQWADDDFVLTDYNDEAFRITAGGIPTMVGKRFRDVFPERNDWREGMLRCLKQKTTVQWERPVFHSFVTTGEKRYLAASCAYVPPDRVMVHTADITARTLAEHALKESESRFRELAENAPVGIYLFRDGKMTYANKTVESILGYTIDEILASESPLQFAHPDDKALLASRMKEDASGTAQETRLDVRVLTKSGATRHLEVFSSPMRFEGKITMIGTVLDITERKKAERALKESEDRFKTLAEQSPIGIYEFRGNSFTYANPKFAEIMGYPADALVNMPDVYSTVHDDDRQAVIDAFNEFSASGAGSTTQQFRVITEEGAARHVVVYVSKVHYHGEPSHIGTLVDVTERIKAEEALKESERNFRALAETSNAAIIIYTADGTVYANPATEAITEYSKEELMAAEPWSFASPEYRQMLQEKAARRLSGDHSRQESYEIPIITKTGKEKWIMISGGIVSYGGKPAILGTAMDTTERKRAEAALEIAHQERYDQVKQVAGGVAHEIYNALFPAASTLDKLTKRLRPGNGGQEDRNLKLVRLAETSVERAIEMTELVTQFSRLDSHKDIELVNLTRLFDEIIKDRVKISELKTTVQMDVDTESSVRMNRVHAYSLFSNIIKNAVDAMEDVENRVLIIKADRNGDFVTVRISDNGSGIPAEVVPKVFDPFFSTKPRKGTGLGLAICKRIVDIYGGRISVDSALDRGATFNILLKT